MGGYYLRMMYGVGPAVSKLCRVTRLVTDRPNPKWKKVVEVLVGLLAHMHTKSMVYAGYVGEDAGWIDDLRWFFSIFNSTLRFDAKSEHANPNADSSPGFWLHHCDGAGCCRDDADTRHKMVVAILRVVLRSRPQVPALSRWTSTATCADWFLLALSAQNVCF